MRRCEVRDLGRIEYCEAVEWQRRLVGMRKHALIPDQILLVEHPHTITLGRNGHLENLLASEQALAAAGISFYETDRGGDITYHGPGQLVGYPVMDLREWKRDVGAYVRAIEQVMIDALGDFGIVAGRVRGCTGVWVDADAGTTEAAGKAGDPQRVTDSCASSVRVQGKLAQDLRDPSSGEPWNLPARQAPLCERVPKKIGAIGVHISRWVTSHGFALNVNTDLRYFQYIVPCGIAKPVTSMEELGVTIEIDTMKARLAERFGRVFERDMESARAMESVMEMAI